MHLGEQGADVRAPPRHLLHGVGHPLLPARTFGHAVLFLARSLQVPFLSSPLHNGAHHNVLLEFISGSNADFDVC